MSLPTWGCADEKREEWGSWSKKLQTISISEDNAPKQNGDKSADEVAEKLGEMSVKESESKEKADDKKTEADGEKKEDAKDDDKSATTPKKEEETKDDGTKNEKTESKDWC